MILPSITTTKPDWRNKIKQAKELKIEELSFFLTCLNLKERREFYDLAKGIKKVPFIHIRSDMDPKELDYLMKTFQTEVFNFHTQLDFPFDYDYSKYRDVLYIENSPKFSFQEEEIKKFGGICLDITHLENDWLTNKEKFEKDIKMLQKYPVGCNHISAIKKKTFTDEEGIVRYDSHYFQELSEFDYLKKYPHYYFSSYIAIELENSLEEQLKVKEYILNENLCKN